MPDDTVALAPATRTSAVVATSRRDIDVAEVHDFFTPTDSISYEGRGFAEQYGGCKIVEAEVTSIGGELPVNISGELSAPAQSSDTAGVARCNELVHPVLPSEVAAAAILEEPVAHGG